MKKTTSLFLVSCMVLQAGAQISTLVNNRPIVCVDNVYFYEDSGINSPTGHVSEPFKTTGISTNETNVAQTSISKTVDITAGGLQNALTSTELSTVTSLTITGTLDARDFKTMRDIMPVLSELNISTATIPVYTGTEGTYSTSIVTYPANQIPADAFYNFTTKIGKTSLTSISLPLTTTSIGDYAFQYCRGLTAINIVTSIVSIGKSAFYDCQGIALFYIPFSVTTIGEAAFLGCTAPINVDNANLYFSSTDGILFNKNKTTLIKYPLYNSGAYSIPSTVTAISNLAFFGCNSLSSVTIPTSVTSLGNQAFSYCLGMTTLFVPSSVISMGNFTFMASTCYITVDANNPNFSSADGLLFDKNKTNLIQCPTSKSGIYNIPSTVITIGTSAFQNCSYLTTVSIPSAVTSIGSSAFYYCSGLTTVNIPASVTYIGSSAFYSCSGLTSIYAYAPIPYNFGTVTNAFYNVNKTTCSLYVPANSVSLYAAATLWKDFVNIINNAIVFSLDTKTLNLNATPSVSTVTLTANLPWIAASNQSWITLSSYSGSGNNTFSLTAQANPTTTSRTAIITVSAIGAPNQTITVLQSGLPKTVNNVAGGLESALTAVEKATLESLTITGTLDTRDFKTMRDNMPLLGKLDLSGASIAAYTGTEGTYNTTSTVYPANEIPGDAFYNYITYIGKTSLYSLKLPDNVTSIGNYAFQGCNGLNETLTLPSSLTNIGTYAFYMCSKLPGVILPASVATIGNYAFYGCNGLTEVTLPGSVSVLGNNVFMSCPKLTAINVQAGNPTYSSVDGVVYNKTKSTLIVYPSAKTGSFTIPETVSIIDNYAFFICSGLTGITIPTSVTGIGNYAFYSCTGLSNIVIPCNVSTFGTYALGYCNGLKSITVNRKPVDLSLSANVFIGINKTTCTLNVPYSAGPLYTNAVQWKDFTTVTEQTPGFLVGTNSVRFSSAAQNTTVNIDANTGWTASSDQQWLTVNPGSGTGNNTLILNVTANLTNMLRTATVTVSSTGSVSQTISIIQVGLPKTITISAGGLSSVLNPDELNGITDLTITGTIDARDFKTMRDNMPMLAKVDLSSSIVKAYTGAEGTVTLVSNAYPENTVPDYAFSQPVSYIGKTSLTSIIFPSNITTIGYTSFENCSGLTGSLSIPGTVTSIGNYAFYGCKGLTGTLVIPSSVNSLGSYAFYLCTGLTGSLVLPSSLVSIGAYSFFGCSGLSGTLTIPSSVTTIGSSAYGTCSGLTSVSIPSSVTVIGDYAFRRTSILFSVESSNLSYSSLDNLLFDKNKKTLIQCPVSKSGNYTIPAGVTSVGSGAFDGCSLLTSVSLPSTLVSVGSYAFYNCSGLTSISMPSAVVSIGISAFYLCSGLTSISIPATVNSIGSSAYAYCTGLTSIYAYAPAPVDLSLSSLVFNGVNKTACTLFVPTGKLSAYQAAYQWSDFTKMSEFITGTSNPLLERINIYPNPVTNGFYVSGIGSKATICLSDINGRLLLIRQISENELISLNSFPKGMYLVMLKTNEGYVERKVVKK